MAKKELTVEDKLKALYELQMIDSELDKIKVLRGELPIEVKDLEDELVGMDKRIERVKSSINEIEQEISGYRGSIKDAESLMMKYKKQLDEVRNDREYRALMKEIEDQELNIKLYEKRIGEAKKRLDAKKEALKKFEEELKQKKVDLEIKRTELDKIIAKTEKEEKKLLKASEKAKKNIEERLLASYLRIRAKSRNGLAVVTVTRDACGGCFNKVPAQVQLELTMAKKIIACEHCGRVLVDPEMVGAAQTEEA